MPLLLITVLTLLLTACGDSTATSQPATTAATSTKAASATTVASGPTVAATSAVKTVAPVANGNKTGVTDTEIKLGALGPLSGQLAFIGTPIRVIDAYFKMINEQGGIYGRKINYVMEDDTFDPAKSMASINKLVEQDQVLAVTGLMSLPMTQIREYTDQKGVPVLPFISPSTPLYDPPHKLQFGFLPPLGPEARFVVDYATDTLGAKKLAILYQSDAFGGDAITPFVAEAQAKQLAAVTQIPFKITDTDITSQLNTLQQSGADFIYIVGAGAPVTTLVQQLDTQPNKPKIMLSYYSSDLSFYQPLGKAAEGIYSSWFALPPDGDDAKSVQFREFMKKYLPNEAIGYYTQEGYIMGQIIVETLRRAGKDLSRESLVAAAESMVNWRDSYANNITFGPLNRSPINSVYVTQYTNGKLQKVSDWYNLK